jgi:hypothetical protein
MADELERARAALRDAYADGELSEESSEALQSVPEITLKVASALGTGSYRGDVLLVSVLVDDSSSIGYIPKRVQAVIAGHNRMIEAAARRSAGTEVLFHTRYLIRGVLSPYRPVGSAVHLSSENYRADADHTPLYDQSVIILGSVMAKARELAKSGCQVRTFTLLLTDGEDNIGRSTATHVRVLITDMLEFATNHIVAGMGIGEESTFRRIFREMGVPDGWILPASATVEDIERVFTKIERALELASSSEAEFRALLAAGPGS